ncbi:MAG: fluoride efflux transporter CrcB [Bauldia sp.]|uniref:fluoride efflux transporter CrcB n=1 Tax=Bauldia sp. TaxID=2575872 RepID=UPI001DFF4E02|nr:fluoride efflux transporter CrcB [Bauldia sp.]MCB1498095.1 fluoride efflux transporter CrcB [Bauldia sp.]
MITYLWIGLGSALGGMARYWMSGVIARTVGETFPWGTLVVNVVGSFIIGFVAILTAPDGRVFLSSTTRLALMTGFCGGYTTFSSFSLQTLNLLNDGEYVYAGANIVISVVICLVAVWAGAAAANGINTMRWI